MYHDQYVQMKLLAFEQRRQWSAGLIIRTPVDHGIALTSRGQARRVRRSMLAAIDVAIQTVRARG